MHAATGRFLWSALLALSAAGSRAAQDAPSAPRVRPDPAALVEFAGRARSVAGRLAAGDSGEEVRLGQRVLEERLSDLIAALEQAEGGDGDGDSDSRQDEQRDVAQDGGPSGSQGVRRSAPVAGPGGEGELGGAPGTAADLASLPPRLRDKVLQARARGFPAAYEALLADYYRRLARSDGGALPAPEEAPERDDGQRR